MPALRELQDLRNQIFSLRDAREQAHAERDATVQNATLMSIA